MQNQVLSIEEAERIINDPGLRKEAAKTLIGFASIYLSHYFTLSAAEFHRELFSLLSDWDQQLIAIAGFRGSAKSTIAGLALPLWAALNTKAHFIIPINETDDMVKLTIANMRQELQNNKKIIADFGQIVLNKEAKTQFGETNIVLANGVRIMGRSRGQKIRGLRHVQYRSDLVVIDDPEELKKVQKKEYRDDTENWLRDNIIPAINEVNARLIVIGNVLHTDSIMPRLKEHKLFQYREYPLIDQQGTINWRAKYPTEKAIAFQEQKVGRTAWLREYLLKVVPPEGQEIKEEWIQYYTKLPGSGEIMSGGVGVDLAISKKETADFTSMVSGLASLEEGMPKIYVMPNPINQRLSFHETINQMKSVSLGMEIYIIPQFFVEDVAYQKAAIQEGRRHMLPIKAIKPGVDKRARLRAVATYVQNGTVLFPKEGCEDLITQLLGFGVEDHDDLVDAFVYLILGIAQEGIQSQEVISIL